MRALLLLAPLLLAATPDPLVILDGLPPALFGAAVEVERVSARHVRLRAASDDPVLEALRFEALMGALSAAGDERGLLLEVPDGAGGWRPMGGVEVRPPVVRPVVAPPVQRPRGEGALAGRRIAISAGHGWIPTNAGGWRTQRVRWAFEGCGTCRGITEDFFTAELVSRYLLPMLEGMGAEVVVVREPDHDVRPALVVDDGDEAHSEVGGPWTVGNSPGGHAGDYRVLAPENGGEATWAVGAASGQRRLSVRYRHGGNRPAAAELEVVHAGGRAVHTLNQQRAGWIWRDLGGYVFDENSRVLLRPGLHEGYLIADAVKVGGGVHPEAGHPWWQMGALPYVTWAGADAATLAANDVTARPRYAEHAEADLYISIHANASGQAGGSTARGLSTYRYSCQQYNDHSRARDAVNCDDPPGSARLTELVHGAILGGLRADWDPTYGDRRSRVANFGELRNLDGIPGVLIETGFFDNLVTVDGARMSDNRALHDPRWREAFARGLATGVAQYFDPAASAPPLRPEGLAAINQADGTLEVSWTPVAGARAYRLYIAHRGRAWDDGVVVEGAGWRSAGLTPRQVYAFRVSALDANGEGFASQAVAARFRGAVLAQGVAPAEGLMIYGYDRRDAWVQSPDNDGLYAVEHGHGLGASPGFFFDGASDERVEAGLSLAAYELVDLVVGKDSSTDESVSAALRAALAGFMAGGGRLIASGEEIGWDLVARSDDPTEADWVRTVLGAEYVDDDAEAYEITGVGPFAAVGAVRFDDGTGGGYEVRYPDVLAPAEGGELGFVWPDGTGAAVVSATAVYFGAGLEALVGAEDRGRVFAAVVAHLLPGLVADDLDLDGAPDGCDAEPRNGEVADGCAFEPDGGLVDAGDADAALDAEVHEDAALDGGVDAALADAALADAGQDGDLLDATLGLDATQAVDAAESDADPDAGYRFDGALPAMARQQGSGCASSPLSGSGPWGWLLLLGLWSARKSVGRRRSA